MLNYTIFKFEFQNLDADSKQLFSKSKRRPVIMAMKNPMEKRERLCATMAKLMTKHPYNTVRNNVEKIANQIKYIDNTFKRVKVEE